MTATDSRVPAWDDAALVRGSQGLPWWSAVLLALALSATGVFADLHRLDTLGRVFQVCYFAGCVLAVALVQRKGLFGPMVQPPLILGVTVPGVVILRGSPGDNGLADRALDVGEPLINGFPTMALTTGVVLAIGLYRMATQRPPQDVRSDARKGREPSGPGKGGAATSTHGSGTRGTTRERLAELASGSKREERPTVTPAPARAASTGATPGRARGGARTTAAAPGGQGPDVTRTTPVRRGQAPVPASGRPQVPPSRGGPTPPRAPAPQHRTDNGNGNGQHRGEGPPAEHRMTEAQRQAALRVTRSRRSSA